MESYMVWSEILALLLQVSRIEAGGLCLCTPRLLSTTQVSRSRRWSIHAAWERPRGVDTKSANKHTHATWSVMMMNWDSGMIRMVILMKYD